ncbi:MAG: O-antigen ligase family protein [Candidatus Omnitrophota bacterium]|jgi:O-antigen ligase
MRNAIKIDTGWIKIILLFLAGFFLPWGNSLKTFNSFAPYLFLIPTVLLIPFLFGPIRLVSLPMVLFISFLILHTLGTGIIIGPEYFTYLSTKLDYFSPDLTNMMAICKLLSFILYFIVLSLVTIRKQEYTAQCLGFVLGLTAASALKLPEYFNYFQSYRFAGPYNDPNAYAISAGIVFFLCLLLSQQFRNKMFSGMFVLSAWLFFLLILLSQSRSGILAFVLAGCYFFRKHRYFLRGLLVVGIICALSFPLFSSRVLEVNHWADDGGTGRFDIWLFYLSNLPKYFLTGVGLGRADVVIDTSMAAGLNFVPHNTFLEVFVDFGFLGLFFFLWLMTDYWKRIGNWRVKPVVILWGVGACFISALVLRETWFVFILLERAALLER